MEEGREKRREERGLRMLTREEGISVFDCRL